MLVWFIYDISENKARRNLIKIAEKSGLYRVQKSVFLGNIDKNSIDELVLQSEEIINDNTDSLYVFPMCETDFKSVVLLGQAFDKKLINDEIQALFI